MANATTTKRAISRGRSRKIARPLPNAQVRRAKAPRLPTAVESFLVLATRKLVASYIRAIVPIALAAVADFAREEQERADDASVRRHAPPAKQVEEARKVSSYMRTVARRTLRTGLPQFEARSKQAAERAQAHSKGEFARLGLIVKQEPEMRLLVNSWRKDNVARITGLADEHVNRIEAILANGFNSAPETIAAKIKSLEIMSDRRAELIARDQVLTLNAQINRHRQLAAGVTSYVWTTQNDSKVRDAHADLDGTTFEWDSGGDPDEGHPGEPVHCRCIAFPVKPEGDEEAAADDDDLEAAAE